MGGEVSMKSILLVWKTEYDHLVVPGPPFYIHPPIVSREKRDEQWGEWGHPFGASMIPALRLDGLDETEVALVLAWEGEAVPTGCDAADWLAFHVGKRLREETGLDLRAYAFRSPRGRCYSHVQYLLSGLYADPPPLDPLAYRLHHAGTIHTIPSVQGEE
jgi:hypothetical protein